MPGKINRQMLKDFIMRRRLNVFGLWVLTALVALVTMVCAFVGFKRTNILVFASVCLVLLCFVQAIKLRKSFRTLHAFRGHRKKNKKHQEQPE